MGLKEVFRKVGQAIEETKMKIGMKKYKKGGIQIEEKDQKPAYSVFSCKLPLPLPVADICAISVHNPFSASWTSHASDNFSRPASHPADCGKTAARSCQRHTVSPH